MTIELEDMSGLIGLPNTEIVVLIFHKLTHIRAVTALKNVRSLCIQQSGRFAGRDRSID